MELRSECFSSLLSKMPWLNTLNFNDKKSQTDIEYFKKVVLLIKEKGTEMGLSESEILLLIRSKINKYYSKKKTPCTNMFISINFTLFFLIIVTVLTVMSSGKEFSLNRCIIENNYFVMEMTRPITDCNICKNVNSFTILENVTKEEFAKYAYLGRPLLVRGGCSNWPALNIFDYDFFKNLYSATKGAFQSVEEECQFFPFRTKFLSLQEVFNMPEERAIMMSGNEETWYIGWSNCNPDISAVLRHYSKPDFLPDDSELSAIDWIFMGYRGPGASMHLDYVRRPSWQAQIRGEKFWHLLPPPECESVCTSMNVTVRRGDIILVDTNQWYHTTEIIGSEMSVTLGSEYD